MKILFLNFNCIWCPHYETDLEIMTNLKNDGAEIFSLYCDGALNKFCMSCECQKSDYCQKCINAYKNGADLIGIKHSHRFKLKPAPSIEFPVFNSIEDLKNYKINDIRIGFGAASSFMSYSRDYIFNPSEHIEEINGFLNSAYTVSFNLINILSKYKFDSIYLFNGRFAEYYPAIEICRKYNIDFYLHERGSTSEKYQIIKNDQLHRFARYQNEIKKTWDNEPNLKIKTDAAKKWFEDRRNKVEQSWISFVKNQITDRLPEDFNESKENIAIFNSSMDEYGAFDEWKNPIDKNDNNILKEIISHYINDKHKHFYLRIHPNLKDVNTTQIKEIKTLALSNPQNLTIIWPDEKVDSYTLMERCDKIIVFASTMGIEATFWGKPSILAGKSIYDNLDCVYQATNYKTLFKLIDSNLKPKLKENCYPYSYWESTYGIRFKDFQPEGLFNGKFKGTDIRKKRKNIIRRTFKKLKNNIAEFVLNHSFK